MELYVDYQAIKNNLINLNKKYNKNFIIVVKNNAYNLGLLEVVRTCYDSGFTNFATADLDEAIKIKWSFPKAMVLVMNPITDIKQAKKYNISLSITSLSWFNQYKKQLNNIDLHLKVNLGMNRFGIKGVNEIKQIINYCKTNKLSLVGLYAHFSDADTINSSIHNNQVNLFVNLFNKINYSFKYIHTENSAALLLNDSRLKICNVARIGILAYGYNSTNIVTNFLEPTLYLFSKIIAINTIEKGECLSYGTNKVTEKMMVAIVPVGYGDGVLKLRKVFGVVINDIHYPIIEMSMSHTFIKVNDRVDIGDKVEIYGKNIKIDMVAKKANITNSEQLAALNIKKY